MFDCKKKKEHILSTQLNKSLIECFYRTDYSYKEEFFLILIWLSSNFIVIYFNLQSSI